MGAVRHKRLTTFIYCPAGSRENSMSALTLLKQKERPEPKLRAPPVFAGLQAVNKPRQLITSLYYGFVWQYTTTSIEHRPELSPRAAFFAYRLIIRNSAGVDRLPGPWHGPLDLAR